MPRLNVAQELLKKIDLDWNEAQRLPSKELRERLKTYVQGLSKVKRQKLVGFQGHVGGDIHHSTFIGKMVVLIQHSRTPLKSPSSLDLEQAKGLVVKALSAKKHGTETPFQTILEKYLDVSVDYEIYIEKIQVLKDKACPKVKMINELEKGKNINDFFKKKGLFFHADQQRADCQKVNVSFQNLNGKDLSRALFPHGIFYKSKLKNTCLQDTFLQGADLSGAQQLKAAQLAQARFHTLNVHIDDEKRIRLIQTAILEKKKKAVEARERIHQLVQLLKPYPTFDDFVDKSSKEERDHFAGLMQCHICLHICLKLPINVIQKSNLKL